MATAIPKRIYLFWQGPMSPFVRLCIDRIRSIHSADWSVTVLDGENWEEPLKNLKKLRVEHRSDWARMCSLQNGGVWLDATCICNKPVDDWIDMHANAVQGFSAPWSDDTLENWAFAAPCQSRLMVRWKDIFREAIVMGFDSFKRQLPQYIREHAVFDHVPYLTMHACYLMAAHETGERALLSPSCEGPFRELCERRFSSHDVVKALMHEPLSNPPSLIKLRGVEVRLIGTSESREGSFMHSLGLNDYVKRNEIFAAHLHTRTVNSLIVFMIVEKIIIVTLVVIILCLSLKNRS